MLIVKKRRPTNKDIEETKARLSTKPGFIEGLFSYNMEPVILYPYQEEQLRCKSKFTIDIKARQTGWSFNAASDALARSLMEIRAMNIFISVNLEEAKEKIRYASAIYEELPAACKIPLITDKKQELEFANGSRIISHPCREPRGKTKATIWLDEFAHYKNAKAIYAATVPILVRGGGQLHVGSTPMGKLGLFAEIALEAVRRYPGYVRIWTFWWDCRHFTQKPLSDPERVLIAGLPTHDRVYQYGNSAIISIYENMDEDEFRREFECLFLDEASAYIPFEIITAAQDHHLELVNNVDDLLKAQKGMLFGGYDVGRTGDASELLIVDKVENKFFTRLMITLKNAPYSEQKELLGLFMKAGLHRLAIDKTGIGDNLSEDLEKEFGGRVERIHFTSGNKELLASNFKKEIEKRNLIIPANRDLIQQIHSIKRIITATNNVRFDCEKNEKHHADKFWALALALWAGKDVEESFGVVVDAPKDLYSSQRRRRGF